MAEITTRPLRCDIEISHFPLGTDECRTIGAPFSVDRIDGVVVDDEAIERHLLEVVTLDRFAGARDPDDDFRTSLAGAQEKDAFLWWDASG